MKPAAWIALAGLLLVPASAADGVETGKTTKAEKQMTGEARGSFDVKIAPAPAGEADGKVWAPGRMLLDKSFRGDLAGTSHGEMLTAMTDVKGSAGYTAIERFEGTLAGRKGSFVLQHSAIMARGVPGAWTILVVPDSGTGELKGLQGSMTITIEGGDHSYVLSYSFTE